MPENAEYNHQAVRNEKRLYIYVKLNNQAREQFMRAENSERIKAAMENKRSLTQKHYKVNDIVAYYRNGRSKAGRDRQRELAWTTKLSSSNMGRKLNANVRDVRKFPKDDDKEIAWSSNTEIESDSSMRKDRENSVEAHLIKTTSELTQKPAKNQEMETSNMHGKNLKTRYAENCQVTKLADKRRKLSANDGELTVKNY